MQVKLEDKKKWRFLQKYWHKGAYFQDASDNAFIGDRADDIFGRDFSAPVGEDKLDKTVLPKVRPCSHLRAWMYRRCHGATEMPQLLPAALLLRSCSVSRPMQQPCGAAWPGASLLLIFRPCCACLARQY